MRSIYVDKNVPRFLAVRTLSRIMARSHLEPAVPRSSRPRSRPAAPRPALGSGAQPAVRRLRHRSDAALRAGQSRGGAGGASGQHPVLSGTRSRGGGGRGRPGRPAFPPRAAGGHGVPLRRPQLPDAGDRPALPLLCPRRYAPVRERLAAPRTGGRRRRLGRLLHRARGRALAGARRLDRRPGVTG